MRRPLTVPVLMCAAALFAASCGDDPEIITPSPPPQVSETFEGTLNPFSARNHDFAVQSPGFVSVTLTAISPDDPTTVGLSVGTWTGSACQVVVDSNNRTVGTSVTGTATTAGRLCVRIYDVHPTGLPAPAMYTLTVFHF